MAKALSGLRVVYLGDWVFYTGPQFIESPFEMIAKDCHLQFVGKPVTDALEAAGAKVQSFSNWEVYHFEPGQLEAILKKTDVLIISDVEARCFHLSPSFFNAEKHGKQLTVFPDRLRNITRWVERGNGLIFMGGWLGFSGHMEKGGWRRSPIANWLPFECLTGEDLMENSEGFKVDAVAKHPMLEGLAAKTVPPLLGYNEFIPRPNMEVLWRIAGTGHPLLGVSHHGKGRMVTYGSDPVPHWGNNLLMWKGYARFWQQMTAWAAGRKA
ncbi:MAG: glutamine amidotransferase [Lentisphaerae bacterium]|nr:glutamine amidotransferase [Lentisphaerota bacterium]